jgi:hypothetical protein
LIEGAALRPDYPDVVLVTNAHVLGPKPPAALQPAEVRVTFRGLAEPTRTYDVAEVLFTSPPDHLDVTIARLHTYPPDTACCPIAAGRPVSPWRAYIIGHPSGVESVQYSLHDNRYLDADDMRLHYRTPTEPGSSGSPVFDDTWQLVALHHRGSLTMPRLHGESGAYPANEAIWWDSIAAAIGTARASQ